MADAVIAQNGEGGTGSKPLPDITRDEAVALLKSTGILENRRVPFLYLDHIQFQQPVVIRGCEITGFVARGTTFPALSLEECRFLERVELSAKKQEEGAFKKTTLEGKLEIRGCELRESLALRNADIKGELLISNTTIAGPLTMDKTLFAQDVRFIGPGEITALSGYRAQFQKDVLISNYQIPGQDGKSVDLNSAQIAGVLRIIECTLSQNLELKRAHVGEAAREALVIENSRLQTVNLTEAYFHSSTTVTQTEIAGPLLAETPKEATGEKTGKPTLFAKDAAFVETKFLDRCSFHGAIFKGYANFKKCQFAKGGTFNQVEFEQLCSFWESESDEALHFRKAHFMGRANFGKVNFGPKSSFNEATFEGEAHFHDAKSKGDIFLSQAVFQEALIMRHLELAGGLGMQKVSIEKNLNLSGSYIADRFILSESQVGGAILAPGLAIGTWASLDHTVVRGRIDIAGIKVGLQVKEEQVRQKTKPAVIEENEADTEPGNADAATEAVVKPQEAAEKNKEEKADVVPGTFYLSGATFYQDVDMARAFIQGDLGMDLLNTYNEVDLSGARVGGNTYFSRSYFRGTLRCDGVKCADLVATKARFKEEVSFNNLLCNNITLSRSSFDGGFTMRSAIIADRINLNHTDVDGKADFFKCKFQKIFFLNLLVDNFLIHRELLGDRLSSEKAGNYKQARNEFGILKHAFQMQSHYKDMDWAYYRFCRAHRREKSPSWKHPLRALGIFFEWLLLDLGFGYGTRPMNIGGVALMIVLLFASVFCLFPSGVVGSLGKPLASLYPLDALYLSLNTFACMDYGNCGPSYDHWLKYLFSIEGLLGIFLTTMFVATISRKIIRT